MRKAEPDVIRLELHGEYQARYQRQPNLRLTPTATRIDAVPNLALDSIGQTEHARHWLRMTPVLQLGARVEITGQLDLVTGQLAGASTRGVSADESPRDELDGFKNIQPRWLYATFRTDYGVLRVGQQSSHWGMGMFINDGDHPSLFGDYRYGNLYERVAFLTKPLGKDSPLLVGLTGDLVFRDANARHVDGDIAFQGGLIALYERDTNNSLGVAAIYRSQRRDKESGRELFTYTEALDVVVLDATAKFAARAPGSDDTFVFGAAELAGVFGSTNMLRRTIASQIEETTVRSFGGALRAGLVHRASKASPLDRAGLEGHGDFVGQVELGHASGDADPYDNVQRRFAFSTNYKVGLILFDEVMRWQTARAATAAQDPLLTNASRPTPGVDRLPSNGAVFGAQYLYPTFVVRPRQWLDLKLGVLIAQTTADLVDPYRLTVTGAYVNYQGGSPKRHDLGVELDTGVEARVPLNTDLNLALGAQGGVLFPGAALSDATDRSLKTPWLVVGRLGILY